MLIAERTLVTLRASEAAAQCIVISPVCVFVCVFVCLFICESALLRQCFSAGNN